MSYSFFLCETDEAAENMGYYIHEPLRRLVWKSGWYINVHAFNDNDLIINLYQNWPNKGRFQFYGTLENKSLLIQEVGKKFYELTADKVYKTGEIKDVTEQWLAKK